MLPVITDTAINSLNEAAAKIQDALFEKTGERVALEDLNGVLARWLELSIEQLCEDALYHCLTGDRSFAVGRDGFELFLKKVPVVHGPEVAQEQKDQEALALERIA